ncbi:hypothetical protein [Paenibacillus sp. y28]|uniref:hypothetical protein n=1 Tax=Paenibacillus sp. y28 TaxID=3129110 RepID=UPI00301B35BA
MQDGNKPYFSNMLIFLMFVLLFPVSYLMVVIRFFKHWHYTHLKISDLRVGASLYLLSCGFMVFLIGAAASGNNNGDGPTPIFAFFLLFVVLALPGMLLLWIAALMRKNLNKRYVRYQELIMRNGLRSIEALADTVNKHWRTVIQDVYRMMHLGLLPAGQIDPGTFQLVISSQGQADSDGFKTAAAFSEGHASWQEAAPAREKAGQPPRGGLQTVECPGCGSGAQLRSGESAACEYCGAKLQTT